VSFVFSSKARVVRFDGARRYLAHSRSGSENTVRDFVVVVYRTFRMMAVFEFHALLPSLCEDDCQHNGVTSVLSGGRKHLLFTTLLDSPIITSGTCDSRAATRTIADLEQGLVDNRRSVGDRASQLAEV